MLLGGSCNSPKKFDQKTADGLRSLPETLNIVGVRGILGGVATNPVSGSLRCMHQVTTLTTNLLDPGMRKLNGFSGPPAPLSKSPGMDVAAFEAELDRQLKPARARGTVKLLMDAEFFHTLSDALRTAQDPVDMQMYIFDNDDVAVAVADELKAASRRVPVRVLFDDLGTQQACRIQPASLPRGYQGPDDMLAYLKKDSNIDARRLRNIFLTSTHTKIITIGSQRAFIGGMNGREYKHEWHDMMAEVRGPVVRLLQAEVNRAFRQTNIGGDLSHLFSQGSIPGRDEKYRGSGIAEPAGAYDIRVFHTRAFKPQIERAIHIAIRRAERRIWIENPYFADDRIVRELLAARDRGVDVRVVVPFISDQKIMGANNLATASVLLRHGVKVYAYPRKHHLKAALFDDWAFIGSANLDHLSLRLNEEVNIAYSAPAAIREIENRLFLKDFRVSKELRPNSIQTDFKTVLAEMVADSL
jgi:cardiolipin synthase A/B